MTWLAGSIFLERVEELEGFYTVYCLNFENGLSLSPYLSLSLHLFRNFFQVIKFLFLSIYRYSITNPLLTLLSYIFSRFLRPIVCACAASACLVHLLSKNKDFLKVHDKARLSISLSISLSLSFPFEIIYLFPLLLSHLLWYTFSLSLSLTFSFPSQCPLLLLPSLDHERCLHSGAESRELSRETSPAAV